jgi:hypothetical protein
MNVQAGKGGSKHVPGPISCFVRDTAWLASDKASETGTSSEGAGTSRNHLTYEDENIYHQSQK